MPTKVSNTYLDVLNSIKLFRNTAILKNVIPQSIENWETHTTFDCEVKNHILNKNITIMIRLRKFKAQNCFDLIIFELLTYLIFKATSLREGSQN